MTYWNVQVVSKPRGLTDAFRVALVSVTPDADSFVMFGGPRVRNVVPAPFTVPSEFTATARK